MKKKWIAVSGLTAVLTAALAFPALAGEWKQGTGENAGKWWYDEGNGLYAMNGWRWIDDNGDGIAENYCFDQSGWLYVSQTTPDQKTVNEKGALVQDGVVVTRDLNAEDTSFSLEGTGTLEAKTYKGIEFSLENLGVSSMAVGSVMYPRANTVTAERILEKKRYYDSGTDSSWMNDSQKAEVDQFISQWKEQYIRESMSEDEKGRAIFDWMTNHITYDKSAPNHQSSYGVFIDRRGVCGGFANGFMAMAKACGLEVKYVFTADHGFNLVKLDGTWYAVDVTWGQYKNRTMTGVYYCHTTPVGDTSVEEKAAERKKRYENRSQSIAEDNERYREWAAAAFGAGAVFQADDENVCQSILDYVYSQVEGKSSSQPIRVIVYTGGRNFQAFNKMEYTYNGVTGRIDDVLEPAIKGHVVDGFEIGSSSSCGITWQKNSGTDGVTTYVTTWKDDAGSDYVILNFNINPWSEGLREL